MPEECVCKCASSWVRAQPGGWVRAQPGSGDRALPGGSACQGRQQLGPGRARQVQPAKCDSSRSRAQPGGARALRANHKTSGAVRLQPCPSLRWQGGRIRKGKSWIDRDVPPLRTLLRDRVGGVRGMQGGLGEHSQAPLVPLARAVPGSSCCRPGCAGLHMLTAQHNTKSGTIDSSAGFLRPGSTGSHSLPPVGRADCH